MSRTQREDQSPPLMTEQTGEGSIPAQLSVRYAEKEDLPEVYVMYLEALRETGRRYNDAKALDYVLLCWSQAPTILLEKEQQIIGVAGLSTSTTPYGYDVSLTDYVIYVRPEYRSIKTWEALTKAIQGVSDRFQIPFIGDNLISGDIKAQERLIRRAGAKPIAIKAIYEAKHER